MFELPKHKAYIKGLHEISENRCILFSDSENDLLYSGTNSFGNRLLCSILFDDDNDRYTRNIHALVTDAEYYEFLNKQISFLNILKRVESFFLVDFNYQRKEVNHALATLEDLPEDFQPLENSYCPDYAYEPTFTYLAILRGNDADAHKVKPEELNDVNSKFFTFLKTATNFMNDLDVVPLVFNEPSKIGSFEVKFRIELTVTQTFFNSSISRLTTFVNDFAKYTLSTLPIEDANVFKEPEIKSETFKKLEQELEAIYKEKSVVVPDAGLEQHLVEMMQHSIEPLKDIQYNKSFTRIEFANLSNEGVSNPIALVDEHFIAAVEDKFIPLEIPKVIADVITYDDFAVEYKIQVYQFSTRSGNGSCLVQVAEDKIIQPVALHVKGKNSYANTAFTKSLDESRIVAVNGIAKRVNDIIKEITCQF